MFVVLGPYLGKHLLGLSPKLYKLTDVFDLVQKLLACEVFKKKYIT